MKHKNFFFLMTHKKYNPRKGIYIWFVECEHIYESVNIFIVIFNNFNYFIYMVPK